MGNSSVLEIVFVIFAMGLWFLFPLGLFMAMNSIDRYGERELGIKEKTPSPAPIRKSTKVRKSAPQLARPWPHLLQRFRHH